MFKFLNNLFITPTVIFNYFSLSEDWLGVMRSIVVMEVLICNVNYSCFEDIDNGVRNVFILNSFSQAPESTIDVCVGSKQSDQPPCNHWGEGLLCLLFHSWPDCLQGGQYVHHRQDHPVAGSGLPRSPPQPLHGARVRQQHSYRQVAPSSPMYYSLSYCWGALSEWWFVNSVVE